MKLMIRAEDRQAVDHSDREPNMLDCKTRKNNGLLALALSSGTTGSEFSG